MIAHAFFKGTLFLGAGSVIHGNADNQDMRIMGRLRKFMPFTAVAFIVAWLAIAGVPPFAGFWSKDEILVQGVLRPRLRRLGVGLVAALITGFYMTREVFLVFFGNERFRDDGSARAAAVPVVSGGSDDVAVAARPRTRTPATSTPRRTSSS